MTTNQRTVTDAYLYTYGEWISPSLDPSLFRLPTGEDDWGIISWNEQYTAENGDGDGLARIDILLASDNSVLQADFVHNDEGIDLSTYAGISNNIIKIRVKLYGLNAPTPIVNRLLIRSKNGGNYTMLTAKGLMTFLERGVKSTPTRSKISAFEIGTGSITTPPTEADTALDASVFGTNLNDETTITEDSVNYTVKIRGEVSIADANGYAISEAGNKNTDASLPLCSHEKWTPAINKNGSTSISLIWTYQADNA